MSVAGSRNFHPPFPVSSRLKICFYKPQRARVERGSRRRMPLMVDDYRAMAGPVENDKYTHKDKYKDRNT